MADPVDADPVEARHTSSYRVLVCTILTAPKFLNFWKFKAIDVNTEVLEAMLLLSTS